MVAGCLASCEVITRFHWPSFPQPWWSSLVATGSVLVPTLWIWREKGKTKSPFTPTSSLKTTFPYPSKKRSGSDETLSAVRSSILTDVSGEICVFYFVITVRTCTLPDVESKGNFTISTASKKTVIPFLLAFILSLRSCTPQCPSMRWRPWQLVENPHFKL